MNKTTSDHVSRTTLDAALHLSLSADGARHTALENALRAAIRDGRLPAGARVPSTRELAIDLGLARGTVVEAYAQLQAEGYLEARHGSGSWVTEAGATAPPATLPPEPPPITPRFSFHPGLPDLTAFPRAAWTNALRRGLREAPASSLGYDTAQGRLGLREALAEYLARARGVVADPGLIVVCGGFGHGLSLLARVIAASGGSRIAMEDPCLAQHRDIAAAAGLRPVPMPVDAHGASTQLLPELSTDAAVLTPAHHYPLGAVLRPDRRAAALTWARTRGALLIEDDYDAELRYDRQAIGALQPLAPDHIVYCGTVSKTLAPGLRLGWLVVPQRYLAPILALREVDDIQPPALDQIAFAELLRSGSFERHVRTMRGRYRVRRDRLVSMLAERVPAVAPIGISAGLRVLLELPRGAPPAEEIVARAAEQSMFLLPVAPAHHNGKPGRDGIIVGYGALAEHSFEAGIDALCSLLASLLPASGTSAREI